MLELTEDNLEEYLSILPKETFDNEDKILNLCEKIKTFKNTSDYIKNKRFISLFKLISNRLCYNKNFAKKLINYNSNFMIYMKYELLEDKDIILNIIKNDGYPEFNYNEMLLDIGFLMEIVNIKPSYIKYAPIEYLYDINLIKKIAKDYPKIINFIPYHFQSDKEILDLALLNQVNLYFIDEEYIHKEYVIDYFLKHTNDFRITQITLNLEDIDKIKKTKISENLIQKIKTIHKEKLAEKNKLLLNEENFNYSTIENTLMFINDDYKFMLEFMKKFSYHYIDNASNSLLNNKKFIKEFLLNFKHDDASMLLWQALPLNMKFDFEIIKLVHQYGYDIESIITILMNYEKKQKISFIFNLSSLIKKILKEKSITLIELNRNNLNYFEKIDQILREDKDVIHCYLQNVSDSSDIFLFLDFISPKIKLDPEIVFHTLKVMKKTSYTFDKEYFYNLPIKLKIYYFKKNILNKFI